jgi:hypothetical protein
MSNSLVVLFSRFPEPEKLRLYKKVFTTFRQAYSSLIPMSMPDILELS